MAKSEMSHKLVALDDVLGALTEAGPLSTDALAGKLRLSKLDARLVLVDAHAHRLVSTNCRGEWMITEAGREALAMELEDRRRVVPAQQDRWSIAAHMQRLRASGAVARWLAPLDPRYLARRGLPLAVGAIVGAGGVAVASSRLESATEGPPVAATHVKAHHHRRHTRATGAQTVVLRGATSTHHRKRSTLLVKTTSVHRGAVAVVGQIHRRSQTQCGQRHQSHGRGARVTGACAGGRKGAAKSRNGAHKGASQHTGAGSGSGAPSTIWPPAANVGH